MAAQRKRRLISFSEVTNDHSLGDQIQRLRSAVDRVQQRVNVSPASRVAKWIDALQRLHATDKRSVLEQMVPTLMQGRWDHPYRDAFRALVDSRMFVETVENLLPKLSDRDLHDLVSGSLHPLDDSPASRARDREFELFLAAICERSGLQVRLTEPDILFELNGRTYSVAAKRLGSPKQVDKRFRKAESQIVSSGHSGFMVMDVSRILDPDSLLVLHWRSAQQTVSSHVLAFINNTHRRSFQRRPNDLVHGVLLRAVFPLISEGFRYGTYEDWWAASVPWGDASATNQFLRALLRGLQDT